MASAELRLIRRIILIIQKIDRDLTPLRRIRLSRHRQFRERGSQPSERNGVDFKTPLGVMD